MNASIDRDADFIAGFLAKSASRRRRLQLVRALAAGSLAGGAVLAGSAILDRFLVIDDSWRWAYAAGVWGAAALTAWRCGGSGLLRPVGAEDIANLAEERLPGLRDRLLAAHQLAGAGEGRDSPALRARLRTDVAAALAGTDARRLLPLALLKRGLLAAGLVVGAHGVLCLWPDLGWGRLLARSVAPWVGLDRVSTLRIRLLEPSVAEGVVPAGDPVVVVVELSTDPVDGAWIEADNLRLALERRDDGRWAGQIPVGDAPLTFRVRAGDGLTAPHRLLPQPRPRATAITLRITPPSYSGLPSRTVAAERPEISALAGSRVELLVAADQALASAELILDLDGGGSTLPLAAGDGGHRGAFILERNGTARLRLVAAETGFASAAGGDAEVRAIPDLVPTVALHRPTGELVAPGDELLWLEGEAGDDVGLARVACEVRSGGGEWRELSGTAPDRPGAWPLREKLDLLALGAVPGDRIEARLVAVDRKGSRAESAVLAVTVADPGYPAARLAGAEVLEALTVLGLDAARRGEAASVTAAAWAGAAGEGRQEELAHAAALAAVSRLLDSAGALVRSRLPSLRGGPADDLQLCGRAVRRLADRTVLPERAKATPATASARVGCDEYAACLAALAAAEAAQVALRDLQRLDRDQDDARVLAAGGGGERSQRRLAAAAVQAATVGQMFERIAVRAPAAKQAVEAIAKNLAAARADTAITTAAGAFEGAYFAGRAFNERKLVRGDPAIRFDSAQPIAPGLAWNEFSVRWLGTVKPPAPGQWTFITTSDDGVRLWLGGKLVIDRWTDHTPVEDRAVFTSDGSPIELRLEYFQGGGGGKIRFDWQGPDGQRKPVVASGGGAQLAIAAFQQRLQGVQRAFNPVAADLLAAASAARRRLAVLAGDEAASIEAKDETASAIAARLADLAALEEARADADTQAVSDLAQAAAALAALPETAERKQLAADVAAVAAEAQAERAAQAAGRAGQAPTPLAAAEELLRSRPRKGSAVEKAADALLAAAKAGRPLDQGLRDAISAAKAEAETGQAAAQQAATAARQRLGDDTPRLAARLTELAKQAETAARSAAADPTAAMAEARRLSEAIEEVQRDLHRDANRHDRGDTAERARARDADGAAALLAQPPPRAEELLRRATAASDPRERAEALAQAAQQQATLAADLALAGRHWQALAEGRDPAPTRRELRKRETEAGVANGLDAVAAERDRLAALAEADAARAQAGLAEALKDDAKMRRELERLSDAEAAAAKQAAEAAAERERQLAAQAKAAADARAARAQAAQQADAALDTRMRELAQQVRAQAERSANAPQARPKLDSAATALDRGAAAPDPTASAQSAQAAAAELNAAAERMDAAAAPVQTALDQRKTEEAAAAARRDAARTAADAARQQATAAEQAVAAARTAAEAAQRARDAAQAESERARAAAEAAPPAGTDPAAAAAAQASARESAQRAAAAATQASEAAAQAQTRAEQSATAAAQAGTAAQAAAAQQAGAQQSAEQAVQARTQAQAALDAQPRGGEAREQAKRAAGLAAQAQAAAAAAAAQRGRDQAEDAQLASAQRTAAAEAATAATQAARAARHQERLGEEPGALAASAAQLAAAQQLAAQLGERLAAGEQPAGELAATAKALADAAQAMGQAADGQQPAASGQTPAASGEAPAASGEPAPSGRDAATSQALARALDSLDAGAAPAQALAEARAALGQARAAARRESRGNAPPSEGGTIDREAGNSGTGVAAQRALDWGRLPKELARELLEGDREAVPEEYRRQVDSYFRAIGERAQEPR